MSREYERYVPKKELPEEIKQLPQEETKCNFCGISYLVHHEVSRLENHVKELQDSLDESERNHKNSIKELMTLRKDVVHLEEKLQAREKWLVYFHAYTAIVVHPFCKETHLSIFKYQLCSLLLLISHVLCEVQYQLKLV